MASISVKFRPSGTAGHSGTIFYQIIHDRKTRLLSTTYRIFASEWDDRCSTVVATGTAARRSFLAAARDRIARDVERLIKIDRRLSANGVPYTANDVVNEFASYCRKYSLFNFMESVIAKLKQHGRDRTSETYRTALNSFKRFRQGEDILLDSLDSEMMEAYEAWLRGHGIVPNTISFYNRILRAVYNRATEDGVIDDRRPFKHVYTGIDKTVKRALPLRMIKRIKMLNLSTLPAQDFARDMFLLSFYLRGMSFVDMAYLKKSDLNYGHITYRRRKTGQLLTVEWTKEMEMILGKYPENENEYLLPIIKATSKNDRHSYRNASYRINHNLKKIAKAAAITVPLTLYVARHSWASAAKAKGIPLSVISEGMGHDSETTTQIYLASLNNSVVDRANSLILKSLRQ